MKINIKNTDIELKYSFRSLILYEEIIGETFVPSSTKNIITFIYCTILASKQDLVLSFDEFIDWLDENPDIVSGFTEWLTETLNAQNITKKKANKVKKVNK